MVLEPVMGSSHIYYTGPAWRNTGNWSSTDGEFGLGAQNITAWNTYANMVLIM